MWYLILLIVLFVSIFVYAIMYTCHSVDYKCVPKYIPYDDFTNLETFFDKNIWLTVIVSIYNKQDVIKNTINSVINCSVFNHIELILVDDCSSDNTVQILEEYKQKYNNIKIIKHDKNSSITMTRKHGVEQANGVYTALLDGDDTVDKYFYEELLVFIMNSNYKYDCVCANNINRIYKHKQLPLSIKWQRKWFNNYNNKQIIYKYSSYKYTFMNRGDLDSFPVYVWTKLYETNFIKRVYEKVPEDLYLNMAEDVYINYIITFKLHSYVVYNNYYKYNYHMEYESVSHQNNFIKKGVEGLKIAKNKLLELSFNNRVEKYFSWFLHRGFKDCIRMEIPRGYHS